MGAPRQCQSAERQNSNTPGVCYVLRCCDVVIALRKDMLRLIARRCDGMLNVTCSDFCFPRRSYNSMSVLSAMCNIYWSESACCWTVSHTAVRLTPPFSRRTACCECQAEYVVLASAYEYYDRLNALNQQTDRKFRKTKELG